MKSLNLSDLADAIHETNFAISCALFNRNKVASFYNIFTGDSICGTPYPIVPEKTISTPNRIIARGWRDILGILHGQHLINKDKVIKILKRRGKL